MRPRNTLVTVAPIQEKEKEVGGIIVPDSTSARYQQCEVIAVGPGMIDQEGGRSLCEDLRGGQIVLVQIGQARQSQVGPRMETIGLDFRTEDGRDLVIVEQSQIVGIISDPSDKSLALRPDGVS